MSAQPLAAAGISSGRSFQLVASLLLTAVVVVCLLNSDVYYAFLVGPFFGYGLAATLILQVRAKAPPLDFVAVFLLAVVFFCVDWFGLHYTITIASFYSFVGLASLLVFGLRTIWARGNRELLIYCFLPALALAIGMRFDAFFLAHSASMHGKTLDLYLYAADCSFGLQCPYIVGQFFMRHRWIGRLSLFVYESCMVPLVLVYAVMFAQRKRALNAFVAFAIAGPIDVVLFLLVPGVGPIYAFPNFPIPPLHTADVARLVLEPIVVTAPRNAIPSLHLTWALLAYWNTRRGPLWLRVLTFILVIGTVLATLGTGQHYLVDLIAAVPFSLLVQALASNSFRVPRQAWTVPFIVGLLLTLIWLALVSFGVRLLWSSLAIPWLLSAATLLLSGFFYVRLRRQEDQELAS
ncbi:MAG TPA: phosphatase PAP2 family protein [Candidatus Koribacter sp.]